MDPRAGGGPSGASSPGRPGGGDAAARAPADRAEPAPERAPRLVLGSASPRRRALLAQIGVVSDAVLVAGIDETPYPGELPRDHAERLARAKAGAVAALPEAAGAYVLTADTVVAVGRRILGKPADATEAVRFLLLLSGRRHRVTTAVCLGAPDGRVSCRLVETRVTLKRLSDAEISAYVRSGEWRGKAGGYAIQGIAAAFVPAIGGSYTNVVGLPLTETAALLAGMGYPVSLEGTPA